MYLVIMFNTYCSKNVEYFGGVFCVCVRLYGVNDMEEEHQLAGFGCLVLARPHD